MHRRLLALACSLSVLGGLVGQVRVVPAAAASPPYDAVIDLSFPTDPSRVWYDDWYHAARSSGAHKATDLIGSKGLPIRAAYSGRIASMPSTPSALSGYWISIDGDDGRRYSYIHLDNDNPGTDDGLGGPSRAYAPGLAVGSRVGRGQLIGFMGDSGNAESTDPHLHLSVRDPRVVDPYGTDYLNPYPSLRAAQARGDFGAPAPIVPTGPVPSLTGICPPGPTQTFADVPATNAHHLAVECLVSKGIAEGISAGTYGPAAAVNRLQMASFVARLLRAAGVALPAAPPDVFSDDTGSVHELAANQLVAVGVIRLSSAEVRTGEEANGDGTWRLLGTVAMKRDRMAAWTARAYGLITGRGLAAATLDYFWDDSALHHADINALAKAGIVQGHADGSYRPREGVRRDQMASYLARLLALASA